MDELGTSVEDTGSDVHLINLEEDFKGFQPSLEERGFHLVEDSTCEVVEDTSLSPGDLCSRKKKIMLGPTNGQHFQAWQRDILNQNYDIRQEESHPVFDLESCNHQGEESLEAAVVLRTRKWSNTKKKEEQFVRYVVSLNELLLSDGRKWRFELDDVLQIVQDVAWSLAEDYHDKSIVYGDMQAGNIHINDFLRAFLIASEKSKMQTNRAELIRECFLDMRELCKVMGGLYQFYMRNKPRDAQNSNQKEETALFALLRKGYTTDGLTAEQFLDELGHILNVQVQDQELQKKEVMVRREKKAPRQVPRLACSFSFPQTQPSILPGPGAVRKKNPEPKSDSQNPVGPVMAHKGPAPDSVAASKVQKPPDLETLPISQGPSMTRGPGAIRKKYPEPKSKHSDRDDPVPKEGIPALTGPALGADVIMKVPKPGYDSVRNVLEPESSALIRFPDLESLAISQAPAMAGPGPGQGAGLTSNEVPGVGSAVYTTGSSVGSSRDAAASREKLMSDFELEMFKCYSSEASFLGTETEQI
ncbi:uncharacterized protein LOC121426360 isoform X1 [Lytechinus variegatus]|uniref:uncharacterized protein LOC121426360 isoform X1 n=1 Tax=Lytechinus variegatus TaxID=7654 RepID=UPI001BB1C37E|nr:uncharacterized protein LOC121426360 isoform X1 [Lytechinus variegatus]XP_041478574.1 uncharacterized protein LOC121426360 isoform X1 [Lytechinus variegatus]